MTYSIEFYCFYCYTKDFHLSDNFVFIKSTVSLAAIYVHTNDENSNWNNSQKWSSRSSFSYLVCSLSLLWFAVFFIVLNSWCALNSSANPHFLSSLLGLTWHHLQCFSEILLNKIFFVLHLCCIDDLLKKSCQVRLVWYISGKITLC